MPEKKEQLIHLVTRGSYDDYSVLCGAPTRKDAIAIAKKASGSHSWDELRAESYHVYTADLEPTWVYFAHCEVSKDGVISKKETRAQQYWPWELQYVHPRGGERELAQWNWWYQGGVGYIAVAGLSGKSVEEAFKRCVEDFSKSPRLRKENQLKGTVLRPTVVLRHKTAKRRERLAKKEGAKTTAKKGG